MPKSSITLHKNFLRKLTAIIQMRMNFERAFSSSAIQTEDICQAYAGLYLDLFTEFESLIENLFLGLLNGHVKHHNTSVSKKITIRPISEIESVLLGKRSYLEWLPYSDNTLDRANIYFNNGNPFTFLNQIQKDKISSYHKIRNAIAHKSKKAINDFNQIISPMTLFPHERTAQGFLRSIPNMATGKTQLEIIIDELKAISFTLCN